MSLVEFLALCERQCTEVLVQHGDGPIVKAIHPLRPEERMLLTAIWTQNYYEAQEREGRKTKEARCSLLRRPRVMAQKA